MSKAPDKICISTDIDIAEKLGYKKWMVEYIRKDALLEWLQEARAVPHDGAIWRDTAFMEVITKINTM